MTLRAVIPGGGTTITLKNGGVNNSSQSVLNLVGGTNVTVTDGGGGTLTIAASGGGLAIGNAVTGGGANQVLFEDASQNLGSVSGFQWKSSGSAGDGITISSGPATTGVSALSASITWNNAAQAFPGAIFLNVTNTNSASGSKIMDLQVGGASKFNVDKFGAVVIPALGSLTAANCGLGTWNGATVSASYLGVGVNYNSSVDCVFSRISAGLIALGNGAAADFSASMKLTDLYTTNASFLIRAGTTLTNGAGSSAGTLTNAPGVGNPTKWIGIDDNGTTRYIPAW